MPETDAAGHPNPNIYRAILKRSWCDVRSGRVSSEAFKLREMESGLSVLKAGGCSTDICLAKLNQCFGEFVLQTASVKNLGLRVVDDDPNAPDFSENHAEIIGIPTNPTTLEEMKQVEDFASNLAAISVLYYDRYGKYT